MKKRNGFPAFAVRNSDFVTRNRKEGLVLDFQVDVETLPATGMLCVHSDTITAAAKVLGLQIQTDATRDRIVADRIELDDLRLENERLRTVLGLLDGVRLGDMEKVQEKQDADETERKEKIDVMKMRAARKQESRVRVAKKEAEEATKEIEETIG